MFNICTQIAFTQMFYNRYSGSTYLHSSVHRTRVSSIILCLTTPYLIYNIISFLNLRQKFINSVMCVIGNRCFSFQVKGHNCYVLQVALKRYTSILFVRAKRNTETSTTPTANIVGTLNKLDVYLMKPCGHQDYPSLDMDEKCNFLFFVNDENLNISIFCQGCKLCKFCFFSLLNSRAYYNYLHFALIFKFVLYTPCSLISRLRVLYIFLFSEIPDEIQINSSSGMLIASYVWGILRGLETFSQLVTIDRDGSTVI